MTTPDQAALMAVLGNEFAGVDTAQIFGSGRNFEPGTGRLKFGICKINTGTKKTFIQECKIVHFRGGSNLDGSRVADTHFTEGDDVSYVVNFAWVNKDSHFKAWGLAVMRALALKRGQDPKAVTADMIKGSTCAQIMSGNLQEGLEVDFDAIHQKTQTGGTFTKVMFHGDRAQPPRAMSATPPAPAQPAPTHVGRAVAAAQTGGATAIDALMGSQAVANNPSDPLAALMGTGNADRPVATLPTDPLAALMAAGGGGAAPTRDQKIAKLRGDPRFAALDFTKIDDATVNNAYDALNPPF